MLRVKRNLLLVAMTVMLVAVAGYTIVGGMLSSVGVALIGAIVLAGLTNVFVSHIESDERIAPEVAQQVSVAAGNGVDFVPSDQLATAAADAGRDAGSTAISDCTSASSFSS